MMNRIYHPKLNTSLLRSLFSFMFLSGMLLTLCPDTFGQAPNVKTPAIAFLVTGQSVSSRRHRFQFYKVNFRIVNKSKNRIIIYGLKREGAFEPTGDVVEFNNETNTWVYKTEPVKWNELPEYRREEFALQPGQALEFSEEYVNATGKRLKRSAFVSLGKDQPPRKIETKAFDITL